MMTITKIEKDNLDYLFKHSTQEYFQAETQENEKGYFTGTLSKWQKMEGKETTKKEYDRLMSYNKDFKGVEIDPSPSKDWTNLYNRVSPQERKELTKIWNETMQDVAKAVEQNTYYRETKNGKTEYKLCKGLHIAIFNHHTARPVEGMIDGQEHSHIVIFPQVLGQDNKFHSHTLMDLKYEDNHETLRYFDAVMNHGLAKGLNRLGYAVSPTKHGFTIDGMQENIRQEFSKRTNQINLIAGEDATYADKKKISLQVRENKTQNNLTSLRADWQGKMDQLGFTSAEPLKSEQKDFDKSLSEIAKEKGKNVFSNKELKTLALQQATFSNKTVQEKLKEFKEEKKLEYVGKNQHIFKSNFVMQKFTKLVKSKIVNNSLEKKKTPQTPIKGKPTPILKIKGKNKQLKNIANASTPIQSSGELVNEFLSDIKNLEQQLSGLKLDDPKRAQIEGKIGDLKNKIKELLSEKVKNLTAKSATKENQKEQKKETQEEEKPEEEKKKEKTIEESAEDFINELEKDKQHLANPELEKSAQQANFQAQQQAQQQLQQAQTIAITVNI